MILFGTFFFLHTTITLLIMASHHNNEDDESNDKTIIVMIKYMKITAMMIRIFIITITITTILFF